MVVGSFADLCVASVPASVQFYRSLLGLEVLVDHGWYAELGADDRPLLAMVQSGHETLPSDTTAISGSPRGLLVSFIVDDVDDRCAAALQMGCSVLVGPVTELGQRHFMVADPDGAVVDVIECVPMGAGDLRRLARYRRSHHSRIPACR